MSKSSAPVPAANSRADWSIGEGAPITRPDAHLPHPDARAQSLAHAALGTMLTGPILFGLLGYGADRLFSSAIFLPVGMFTGMVLSIAVVWLRYGLTQTPDSSIPGSNPVRKENM